MVVIHGTGLLAPKLGESMRHFIGINRIIGAIVLSVAASTQAAFPDKAIHLIVPFPPNGTTDVVARRISQKLGDVLGQAVIIENKGGAGATIGTQLVANAPADGYTLLMATNSHTANPSIYKSLGYDTVKSFTSVIMLADTPGLVVIHPSVKANTLLEFIALAKKSSPPLLFGTAGSGTFPHLATELLIDRAGIEMVHIPYKGAGPAMIDLLGGVYQFKVDAYPTSAVQLKADKLRALAVTSLERMPQIPDIPTVAELGFPGFETTFWMAILAPAGTPQAIVQKQETAFVRTLQDPQVVERLIADGVRIIAKPASYVDDLIAREMKQWPPIVKKAGIAAN